MERVNGLWPATHLLGKVVILHLAMLRCVRFLASPIDSGRAVI